MENGGFWVGGKVKMVVSPGQIVRLACGNQGVVVARGKHKSVVLIIDSVSKVQTKVKRKNSELSNIEAFYIGLPCNVRKVVQQASTFSDAWEVVMQDENKDVFYMLYLGQDEDSYYHFAKVLRAYLQNIVACKMEHVFFFMASYDDIGGTQLYKSRLQPNNDMLDDLNPRFVSLGQEELLKMKESAVEGNYALELSRFQKYFEQ